MEWRVFRTTITGDANRENSNLNEFGGSDELARVRLDTYILKPRHHPTKLELNRN